MASLRPAILTSRLISTVALIRLQTDLDQSLLKPRTLKWPHARREPGRRGLFKDQLVVKNAKPFYPTCGPVSDSASSSRRQPKASRRYCPDVRNAAGGTTVMQDTSCLLSKSSNGSLSQNRRRPSGA